MMLRIVFVLCAPWITYVVGPKAQAESEASSPRSEGHALAEAKVACHRLLDADCVERGNERAGEADYTNAACESSSDAQGESWWTCSTDCSAWCVSKRHDDDDD